MNNEYRNEVSIEIAGKSRTMRATFGAIRGIEAELKTGLVAVLLKFGKQQAGFTETATVIFHGLRAVDPESPSFDEVGEALVEEGIDKFFVPTLEFLTLTMRGVSLGNSPKKKAKA